MVDTLSCGSESASQSSTSASSGSSETLSQGGSLFGGRPARDLYSKMGIQNKPYTICSLSRCVVAGVPIDRVSIRDATTRIIDTLYKRTASAPLLIMGPNAQLIILAQKNAKFAEALGRSALNVPDGISVVLASKLLGKPLPARVTGGDLMERLCAEAARYGLKVFFLGGLLKAAELAAEKLKHQYPALLVAGTYCPPYGFEHSPIENAYIRRLITETAPDLLFVAFGAPKQEIWMLDNCTTLPIGAAMSVGAALDTQAGLRKRAPRWVQLLWLEWLYRLVREPRRLWRRYLIGNIYFVYLVLKQYLFSKDSAEPIDYFASS